MNCIFRKYKNSNNIIEKYVLNNILNCRSYKDTKIIKDLKVNHKELFA